MRRPHLLLAVLASLAVARCVTGTEPGVPSLLLTTITTGSTHTCGLTADSLTLCWGDGRSGQLGVDTAALSRCQGAPCSRSPRYVVNAPPLHAIAAGRPLGQYATGVTCGLGASGHAYCWGSMPSADVLAWSSTTPESVATQLTFASLGGTGLSHVCGLDANGAAHCWGHNYEGELGTGQDQNQLAFAYTPVAVTGGHSFVYLTVGAFHSCGLIAGGQAVCWGDNTFGQLGHGGNADSVCGFLGDRRCQSAPVAVAGGHLFSSLSAGDMHTCGIDGGGAIFCWGRNDAGQLGIAQAPDQCANPSSPPDSLPCARAPVAGGVAIPGTTVFIAQRVTAGGAHTCVQGNRGLYCWGANDFGQLGSGLGGDADCPVRSPCRPTPRAVLSPAGAIHHIAAGGDHTCALADPSRSYIGHPFCWGANSLGQLGNGTGAAASDPVAVVDP